MPRRPRRYQRCCSATVIDRKSGRDVLDPDAGADEGRPQVRTEPQPARRCSAASVSCQPSAKSKGPTPGSRRHAGALLTSRGMTTALGHLRVLDLTRVLAGPWCTQLLADLGADVIKVERPGSGDDTRAWGPPYLRDADGNDTSEAAYYLAANRNKRSITVDIARPEGQDIVRRLARQVRHRRRELQGRSAGEIWARLRRRSRISIRA